MNNATKIQKNTDLHKKRTGRYGRVSKKSSETPKNDKVCTKSMQQRHEGGSKRNNHKLCKTKYNPYRPPYKPPAFGCVPKDPAKKPRKNPLTHRWRLLIEINN